MLATMKRLLRDARRAGSAVGAFNVENAEMVRAVARAAAETHRPVIFQTTPSTLRYLPPPYFVRLAEEAVREFGVTAALHLDHGNSFELAQQCIDCGYSSVMIDGSPLSYGENVALTLRVTNYAALYGVSVEAELGTVGGKEDDLEADGGHTDPDQAAEFARMTGVDALAIAFGTAHGFYRTEPKLDLEIIRQVHELTDVPLVMHGGSGLPDAVVRQAVEYGIGKVNFATELRAAFTGGVRAALDSAPQAVDPKPWLAAGMEAVSALVKNRLGVIDGRNGQTVREAAL